MPSSEGSRKRVVAECALLAASGLVFLRDAAGIRHPIDDAYISYRYARNLADGMGLVFNPGEYVEGFTNLAWTLLVAAGVELGFEAPGAGYALGIASGLLALAATWLYARAVLPREHAVLAALAPWILLATPAFPRWSLSGLETTLFVAAVTAALAAFARERLAWTTAALGVATLTRPDGALLAALLFGLHLLARRRELPGALRWPALYGAGVVALTAFRLAYYGAPVPNTFYAKVGGIPLAAGVFHLQAFLSHGAAWLLPPALLALSDRRGWPGAAYVVALAAYVVAIGGDVFAYRFLLPALPVLAGLALAGAAVANARHPAAGAAAGLCVAAAACSFLLGGIPIAAGVFAAIAAAAWALGPRVPAFGRAAGAVLLALLAVWPLSRGAPSPLAALSERLAASERAAMIERVQRIDRGYEGRAQRSVRVLRERGEPVKLVATGAIGALGYFWRDPVLDLYGLVDATIARTPPAEGQPAGVLPGHQRSNADYVLQRRPDYILMPRRGEGPRGLVPAHDALWDHPDLERLYAWDPEVPGYRRRALAGPAGAGGAPRP